MPLENKAPYRNSDLQPTGSQVLLDPFEKLSNEKMFRRLIESANMGFFVADQQERIYYVNPGFLKIFDFSRQEEVIGMLLPNLLFSSIQDRVKVIQRMTQSAVLERYPIQTKNRTGQTIDLILTLFHVRNDQGHIVGVEGSVVDVTEQNTLERALVSEKRKWEQILNFAENIGSIREFDVLYQTIVSETSSILESKRCSLMLIDKDENLSIKAGVGLDESMIHQTQTHLGEGIVGQVAQTMKPVLVKNIEYDKRFQRANRLGLSSRSFLCVPVQFEDRVIGVLNLTDKVSHLEGEMTYSEMDLKILLSISREVAAAIENLRLYKELNVLATVDPLTETFNYRHFSKSLDYELTRLKRIQGDLSLIMMDIDDFKSYNDSFGHPEGDVLLRGFGKILHDSIREMDIACRYAGDEFAVILPNTDAEGAYKVAEKIRRAGENGRFKRKVTFSLGVSSFKDSMTKQELVKRADEALYEAKHKGKNQIAVH